MFEQAVQASEAMQWAAQQGGRALIPALFGCPVCRKAQMIAAPVIGTCQDCGAELAVLDSTAHAGEEP